MKVVLIGCVDFSHHTLEHILTLKEVQLTGVITRKASPVNADFRSLEPLARRAGVPCLFAEGTSEDLTAAWLEGLAPDVVYCFGWSSLLKRRILEIPRLGVVGYHPAALPKNRGRHPIIWALALGLTKTASTFFFMDEGADSGDILSQEPITITPADDALSLYGKCVAVALRQITTFTGQLADGRYPRVPQNHGEANRWRRRSMRDGAIDWRMTSTCLYNLVRALTHPYVGAHFVYDGREIKVWRAEVVDDAFPGRENLEPGKILYADPQGVVVKCGQGVLRLLDHGLDSPVKEGEYL